MKKLLLCRRTAMLIAGVIVIGIVNLGVASAATTPLADQPVLTSQVSSNVMLDLSVEYPTALTLAYSGGFSGTVARPYLGYFDPLKCYTYLTAGKYFQPTGFVTDKTTRQCGPSAWSGHFLNWVTMRSIDTFRWALTGGNRSTDLPKTIEEASTTRPAGTTVLQRAVVSGQGGSVKRTLAKADVQAYTDTSSHSVTKADIDIQVDISGNYPGDGKPGLGIVFWVAQAGSSIGSKCGSGCTEYVAQVEVCRDVSVGGVSLLEANCKKYSDATGTKVVYKPEGLIQQYQEKMYFGAFGYLLTGDYAKDGGVLRARVQSVKDEVSNSGYFSPDPYGFYDSGLGIAYSGTINYLNKFGSISKGYKALDPLSELYAESIKYFMGKAPTPSYVSSVDSGMRDGFPVFGDPAWTAKKGDAVAGWNDPAKDAKLNATTPLWCKKNYIIGIGDVNTWWDQNLYKRTDVNVPPGVDTTIDSKAWTDTIGNLESMSSKLGTDTPNENHNNSYLMAGIAYYSHFNDIRPPYKQTVTTFWMDVLEDGVYKNKNQFWLAAKYGGYKTAKGLQPTAAFDKASVWNALGKTISYGGANYDIPDNYFPANTPDLMVAGLKDAFANIAAGAGAAAGAALSTSDLSTTSVSKLTYQGSYDASLWFGNVTALKISSFDSAGVPTTTAVWDAASKLDAKVKTGILTPNRKIVTLVPTDLKNANPTVAALAGKGKPFLFSNLSDAQKLALSMTADKPSGDDTDGARVLNYLRGDRTYESTTAAPNLYRQRGSVLGDIVDSKVVYLDITRGALYADAFNPGYSSFTPGRTSPLVFVGANDGMLHAFDASESSTTGGSEVFALVPYSAFAGPDNNPESSGIQALARTTYSHHYYVNGTPEIRDVDFARAGKRVTDTSVASDWRTLLVVGLGKGGRSFVAMDVTNVNSSMTESDVAGKVLWEFFHPDMGYSYGRPLIAKTAKWGWVVILTGGYNNVSGSKPGQGVLFVVNPKDGTLLQTIYTNTDDGSATDPLGLAQIEGYTSSYQDYTLEYVYGGDLKGNLWRFDFRSATNSVPDPVKLAQFKAPDGTPQPITTAPKIEYSAEGLKRYVFVGTGRLLSADDQRNSQQHTFYALRDGTQSMVFGSASNELPSPSSTPVARNAMVQVTSLLAGATLSESTPMGWYYDLTGVTDGVTERVVSSLQANDGIVSWIGSMMNSDPCAPGGAARIYSVQYGSGQTVLRTFDAGGLGAPAAFNEVSAGLAGISLARLGGGVRIVGTDVTGASKLYGSTVSAADEPRVVNWRIIRE